MFIKEPINTDIEGTQHKLKNIKRWALRYNNFSTTSTSCVFKMCRYHLNQEASSFLHRLLELCLGVRKLSRKALDSHLLAAIEVDKAIKYDYRFSSNTAKYTIVCPLIKMMKRLNFYMNTSYNFMIPLLTSDKVCRQC